MKFSLYMVAVLIIVIVFQYMRSTEMSEHYALTQVYEFTMDEGRDGQKEIENPQRYLVLQGSSSKEVERNVKRFLDFTKARYEERSIFEETDDLERFTEIIIITESFKGIKRELFDEVKKFVSEGGSAIFLKPSYASPFSSMQGIEGVKDYIDTEGIVFKKQLFPGMDKVNPGAKMMPGSSVNVDLKDDVEIIATDNHDTPILWESRYGRGRVITANTTIMEGKISSGLVGQLVAYAGDVHIMPVFNNKVVHLDDFPAPIPDGFNPIIEREYKMKTRSFFKKIWWKDMERIAQRQNLRYTGFMIGEYNDTVEAKKIGKFFEVHVNDLGFLGRNLYKNGGEIGVHGYNHMSLALDGGINFEDYNYKSWENIENMEAGLRSLSGLIDTVYGEDVRVYSYVPPSNLLTKEGKGALIDVFPYMKSLSGIFTGDEEKGLLIQDVGRDPDFEKLYSLPRFSSGLFYTPEVMWGIYNALATYGSVSHFFHPDDIIDDERGAGRSWEELKRSYEEIFKDINSNFPELVPMIQSESTLSYMEMEELEMDYELTEDTIRVNFLNFKGSVSTYVRIRGAKIKDVRGGEFKLMDKAPDYRLYLVEFTQEEGDIVLGGA